MPTFNPIRPIGPPPAHVLPQPGCVVYTDDGRNLWCTAGKLVVQYPSRLETSEIPMALLDWNLNDTRGGWAYLEVLTDAEGVLTSVSSRAAAVLPGTVRCRPAETNFPADAGQNGSYYLPLARLVKGSIIPFLAGQTCIFLYINPEGVSEMFFDDSGNLWTFAGGQAAKFLPP